MSYLSDRQRVELALPARALWAVVKCATGENDQANLVILNKIQRACKEPLEGLSPKDHRKLSNRIDRVFSEAIEPFSSNVSSGKMGLVIYYLLVDLVDRDILELYTDSPIAEAINELLPALSPIIEIKKVDRSAQRQAEKLFAHLREMGYYGTLRSSQ